VLFSHSHVCYLISFAIPFIQVFIQIENENDNVPLTEQPVYYPFVPENSPAGTKVIQLDATDDDKDPDQRISYRLISGNPEGFFSINTTTGMCCLCSMLVFLLVMILLLRLFLLLRLY
jgi:Cadherin domain